MILREGNDLDRKTLKVVGDMAAAYDFQVMIERVDLEASKAMYFEEGR